MKRILIPAGGAVLATGLLAAGLAGSASAANDVASDPMAKSAATAKAIAEFWADNNGAALRAAKESNVWDGKDVAKLQQKGGYSADSKPGTAPPIGAEKKTTAKVHNVNLPKTIGKVFFVNGKGEKKWCSATSIQSQYRNLVATAGHCVYDVAANQDVMNKWVFVPGYYQGKAPFGIYVGKQAFTHYDFSNFEDYDRDYAFVTVYNGVSGLTQTKNKVSKSDYLKATGAKFIDEQQIKESTDAATEAKAKELASKYNAGGNIENGYDATGKQIETAGPVVSKTVANPDDKVGHDYPGATKVQTETSKSAWEAASNGQKNGDRWQQDLTPGLGNLRGIELKRVTETEYNSFVASKNAGNELGTAYTSASGKVTFAGVEKDFAKEPGGFWVAKFYVNQWYKKSSTTTYHFREYYTLTSAVKDAGRLGDNVGGQGFAWNQPTGKHVRVFGYPAAPHPDGNKSYTGVTPKWCYGKTSSKLAASAAKKIEEHVALKCAMTEGADGGPWLYKYSNAKRIGYVNGVTSTFADQNGNDRVDTITSPYFDGETAEVYRAAAKVWSGKAF
ncbi:trypsin-like serine peptidase [Nonomuraea typhae]|uniref:trypsin-like serine peptidase n=1 Tax=Nonomuraea typhae TaxID=2603600 RepID=UPI0012F8B9AE|nr:hypothetical protein [Nonomuraea typhae]